MAYSRLLVSALVLGAVVPAVKAGLLSTLEASDIIQSTVADTDVFLLGGFFGFAGGQTEIYNSTPAASSWSSSLTGAYKGTGLSVSYTGDLSGYPSGPVTWSATGSYGALAWTGSGSASITDTSASTFQVTFADSVAVGSHTASISATIPGTVLPDGSIMYGNSLNPEAGPFVATIDGVNNGIYYSYHQLNATSIKSDWLWAPPGQNPPFPGGYDNWVGPFNAAFTGTVGTAPEPSSILGLCAACVLMGYRSRLRRP